MKLNNLIFCMAAGLSLVGCGSDDDNNNKVTDKPAETPATDPKDPVDSKDPVDPLAKPLYLVKSTAWTTEAGISLHFITDTLDENTVFDPKKALAINEYTGIALPSGDNPDNAFYVGMKTSGVLKRYTVNNEGAPALDKELDLSGITGTIGRDLLRATQFMSATKAYALDAAGLQVIAFNPTTMTLIDIDPSTDKVDTISLEALKEGDDGTRWAVFPTTDGDRFVGTVGFYPADKSDPGLTKLVIVDSKDNSLATDSVNNCGAVSGAAKDANGNMYFASYTTAAIRHKLGVPGAYTPCMIRVLTGTDEFDDSYLMNMQNLTNNGRMAMGAVSGNGGNIGYNLIMSDLGQGMVTDEATGKAARSAPVWEFHSLDLTDDNAVATKVAGLQATPNAQLPKGIPSVAGATMGRILTGSFKHHEAGKITWMAQIDSQLTSSIYNATNTETWTLITNKIPGQIEFVGRLK